MAAFDVERNCLIVRIVYDGPGFAGKTTNLTRLCELFPVEKRSEMYTPGALKGRTMFFDWLEIEGGRSGQQLFRFQLLTVPGQVQRNYRRRPLLQMADVAVFVCDCNPDQMEATKHSFRQLRTVLKQRETPIPLVVQANKQDHPEALTRDEIVRMLQLPPEVPIVFAVASVGDGVRETISTAVRLAMQEVRTQVAEGLVPHVDSATVGTADDLFMSMLELEDTPEEEVFQEPAAPEPPQVEDELGLPIDLDESEGSFDVDLETTAAPEVSETHSRVQEDPEPSEAQLHGEREEHEPMADGTDG